MSMKGVLSTKGVFAPPLPRPPPAAPPPLPRQGRLAKAALGQLPGPRRTHGAFTIEFTLLLFAAITLFAVVGEFLRVSLINQILATATKSAANRVASLTSTSGNNCQNAINAAFQANRNARWLLDLDNNGTLSVNITTAATDQWPNHIASTSDVEVVIGWDDDPTGGVDWSDGVAGDCGDTGSWLRLRAQASVRPWYGLFRPLAPNGWPLRHESWARNARST